MSKRAMWSKFLSAHSCLWMLKMVDVSFHHALTVTLQGITLLPSPCSVLFIFTTEGCFHTCQGFFWPNVIRAHSFFPPSHSIVGSICESQMLLTCLFTGRLVHLDCCCLGVTRVTKSFHCLPLDYKYILILLQWLCKFITCHVLQCIEKDVAAGLSLKAMIMIAWYIFTHTELCGNLKHCSWNLYYFVILEI